MGRHTRPDTTDEPRRIAMAVRHTIPAPALPTTAAPGLDVTTLSIRPVAPAAAFDAAPAQDARVPGAPISVPRSSPVPPAGPPARLSRRERRAARHERAEQAALAARLARAERRNRQVAAFATPAVPAPRSPDPSAGGPLAVDALHAARPPWSVR